MERPHYPRTLYVSKRVYFEPNQCHRLKLHENIWYDAPRSEVLIDRSKLEDRVIILSKINDTLAKWLDIRHADRAKTMKAIAQRTGQTSIISFPRPIEFRRQGSSTFQTRLQDSRPAALPTSSNTVDGDRPSEEPPD